jgi:hypothetical protein
LKIGPSNKITERTSAGSTSFVTLTGGRSLERLHNITKEDQTDRPPKQDHNVENGGMYVHHILINNKVSSGKGFLSDDGCLGVMVPLGGFVGAGNDNGDT